MRARNNKGVALLNLGRYEDALKAFEEAVTLSPHNTNAWYNKGVALRNLGRYEDALMALNKAVELSPQDTETRDSMGVIIDKFT